VEADPVNDHAPVLHQPLEPTHEHKGHWTPEMIATLAAEYAPARAAGKLRELADKLGVDLYQLYGKAHRLQLARTIRRR
jgi:hypothetical protein